MASIAGLPAPPGVEKPGRTSGDFPSGRAVDLQLANHYLDSGPRWRLSSVRLAQGKGVGEVPQRGGQLKGIQSLGGEQELIFLSEGQDKGWRR